MGFLGLGGRVDFSSDLRTEAPGAHQNPDSICVRWAAGTTQREAWRSKTSTPRLPLVGDSGLCATPSSRSSNTFHHFYIFLAVATLRKCHHHFTQKAVASRDLK